MDKDILHKKLDKITEDITDIKVISAVNTNCLKEHMKRTALSERRISKLETFKWYFAGVAVVLTIAAKIIEGIL